MILVVMGKTDWLSRPAILFAMLWCLLEATGWGQFQPPDREPVTPVKAQALREEGPHVLLLMVKGLRGDGVERLKVLGDDGCWFTRVQVPFDGENAWRTSLLTGTLPWENGVFEDARDWRQALLLEGKPSLPELFRHAGYYTVGGGQVYHQWTEMRDGKRVVRGFDQARAWDLRMNALANDRQNLNEVLKFLRKEQSIPFCITMGLSSVTGLDGVMQRLNEALQRGGLAEETVVAVVGVPEGKEVGEMAMWLRVTGEKPVRAVYEEPVTFIDLLPTLVEAVGEIKMPEGLKGESLLPLLRDVSARRKGEMVLVRGVGAEQEVTVLKEGWRYVKAKDGVERVEREGAEVGEVEVNEGNEVDEVDEVKKLLSALVPESWAAYSRPMSKVVYDAAADGSTVYWLQGGDDFAAESLPDLVGRGLEMELELDYDAVVDGNAVMISGGDAKLGFAVHFQEGRPAFTVRYDGVNTTLVTEEVLGSGRVVLRALFGVDGSLDVAASGVEAHGYAPIEGGFPRQLSGALKVGHGGMVLPKGAAFGGSIHKVAFMVLPGATEEQRAAKATPVE